MLLWILVGIAAFFIVLLLTFFIVLRLYSPGTVSPFLNEEGKAIEESIAEKTTQTIGGIQQAMIIRGENKNNQVLLFLHGGPGSPEYMLARNYPENGLEKEFVVCWWDQRGAGMSYDKSIPPQSMNLQQMVDDTVEVACYLKKRFGQEKIFLMGHSWGSFLGMHTIAQKPEHFHTYIGMGQVVNQLVSEKLAYEYMLAKAIELKDKKLEKNLKKFTLSTPEDVTSSYLMVRTAGMNKLGIGVTRKFKSLFGEIVLPLVTCKEYTLSDKEGYARGMGFSAEHLFGKVVSCDLNVEIPRVEIPIYIVQGRYDYQVSYHLAQQYFEKVNAPDKNLYTFEESAHSPFIEEPEHFHKVLLAIKQKVL